MLDHGGTTIREQVGECDYRNDARDRILRAGNDQSWGDDRARPAREISAWIAAEEGPGGG